MLPAARIATAVLLPGPSAPLPGWLTGVLLVGLLAVSVVVATAAIVVMADVRARTTPRHRMRRRRPDPPGERPRETVGPTGELIELDEARHRLMELR